MMSMMKSRFKLATSVYGILAGLTGYGILRFDGQLNKQLIILTLYAIAHVAFIEISWHYFERRKLTMVFNKQTIESLKTIDSEKLWKEIQKRIKEEDNADSTSNPKGS